jgi:peptidoglycan/LPS O-acetylase OafA/YrhL
MTGSSLEGVSQGPPPEVSRGGRRRLYEVDLVTAIAISLVVVGHVVAREPPEGNQWYVDLKNGIYLFHMPLFMFCSGLVFQHTQRRVDTWHRWGTWSADKFRRLAPGFLLIGIAVTVGKLVASDIIYVDNVETNLTQGFVNLLVDPLQSAGTSVWYIYVLLQFYLVVPLLLWATHQRVGAVLGLGAVLYVFSVLFTLPSLFLVNRFFEYLLFFALGMFALAIYDRSIAWVHAYRYVLLIVFVGSFVVISYVPDDLDKLTVSLASIPAMFAIVTMASSSLRDPLFFIASYTFTIYLFNTITIGVAKGGLLQVFSWDGRGFLLFFPILLIAGLFGPIAAHRYVLTRVPIVGEITR